MDTNGTARSICTTIDIAAMHAEVTALRAEVTALQPPSRHRRRFGRLCRAGAAAGVLTLAVGTAAFAAIPDQAAVIHGCVSRTTGNLRVIDSEMGQQCKRAENPLLWNQVGPSSTIQYVKAAETVNSFVAQDVRAQCPAGKQAISGGYFLNVDVNNASHVNVTKNGPFGDTTGNYWSVIVENTIQCTNVPVTVWAVCEALPAGVQPPALGV